jgi:intracellular septation protein A
MATVPALAISAVWCFLEIILEYVRHRQVEALSVVVIVFLVVGIVTSLLANNVRFSLVKDSIATGVFGIAMLASLLAPRPLTFYFGKQFATDGSPRGIAWWDAMWQVADFRRSQRYLTAMWGLAYVGEAGLRIGLTYVLPTTAMVAVNNFLPLVILAALIAYTIGYARRKLMRP